MVARDDEKIREYTTELAAAGIRASGYGVNITDENAYPAALQRIVAEHPDIDILHYNASAYSPAKPSDIQIPQLMSDLRLNIVGALQAVQAVLPQMRTRGAGIIFLTGGGTAFKAPAFLTSLGIGKAGMRSLAFSLADECKDYGIYLGTVTIDGMVQRGTSFDPELVAEQFWQLADSRDERPVEVVMK